MQYAYRKVCCWENLLAAFHSASRGKRGQKAVSAFEHRLEENLIRLQRELWSHSYQPGPYQNFFIHEPKRRLISAAPFRDRVVHHALCRIIEPCYERSFIADSYANRVGKGTHRALNRAQGFARRFPFVLQCDLRQFFPSIDHAVLRNILSRKIDDRGILWLIDRILVGGQGLLSEQYDIVYFPGDDELVINRPRGLPIGNLTSQFWANVYLNPFDHFVKRGLQCKAYVRYVDDLLFFADRKATLWSWKDAIQAQLERFRLTCHPGAHPRPVTEGIPWLGFIVFPQKRRLKRRKGLYFRRRLRCMATAYSEGRLDIEQLRASIKGWVNHVRFANTVGLRKVVFEEARSTLFAIDETKHAEASTMDISQLAVATAALLSPYLVKAGEKAAEAVGAKLPDTVSRIWNLIIQRFKGKAAADEAVADFVAQPDDEDTLASFRKQLRKCLEADAEFARDLSQLLETANQVISSALNTGSGAIASDGGVAAGEGGVAVKGDVHGGIHIGGGKKID